MIPIELTKPIKKPISFLREGASGVSFITTPQILSNLRGVILFGLLGMSKTIRMRQLITPFPMTERGGIYVEKLWGWEEANGTIPET